MSEEFDELWHRIMQICEDPDKAEEFFTLVEQRLAEKVAEKAKANTATEPDPAYADYNYIRQQHGLPPIG